jgi:teichoic acid transport system permease protein
MLTPDNMLAAPVARTTSDTVESISRDGLTRVTRRPPLAEYLEQLWDRRHFIVADARGRVVSGARGTLLGTGWLVLKPMLDGAVYFTIFGLLLGVSGGIENFMGYLIIGVFLFQFTARCLSQGALSLLAGRSLIRAFSFPRAALPVAVVVREMISLIPVVVVMLVLILAIPPVEGITWRWLFLPAILLLQSLFNLALALIFARATARVPDLTHVIGFGTRFWFYGSGVFFTFEKFGDHPLLLQVVGLNPMFVVLDMTRDVLLYDTTPDLSSWLILGSWTAVLLTVGTVFFWRGEESYGGL